MTQDELIITRLAGPAGDVSVMTLNRPKALNALTTQMSIDLHRWLNDCSQDDSIKVMVLQGEGRAFCAGGDVRSLYHHGINQLSKSMQFFEIEYSLNQCIYHLKKPLITCLDGMTIGGGAGLAAHAPFRLSCEHTQFAMPEVHIGLYPDVGMMHFLACLPHCIGLYLSLTGAFVKNENCDALGISTHSLPSEKFTTCIEQLTESHCSSDNIAAWLDTHTTAITQSTSSLNEEAIAHYFSQSNLNEIFEALEQSTDPWAQETLATLKSACPTSLAITFRHYEFCKHNDFDTIMAKEYELSKYCLSQPDFYEGVRTALIDKQDAPTWSPCITDADLKKLFT